MDGPTAGTATILFSDIVGSTEQRVALGDRAADELRRRHDELLTAVIERNGGRLVKRLGDGLMATFGGSAEAVSAAVGMQTEMDRLSRRASDGERIEIRVGLSAGDVTWEDGDCHGTPVVTAARLCDAAETGQILCDDLVRGLARGRTDLSFTMVGELELKGLSDAVIGFSVPWVPATAEVAPLPSPLRVLPGELPYAGREEERERLRNLWKSAQTEGALVVLIAGEPGIGKTRLVAELARRAHDDGALVLLGRCDEQVPAPHAPWIEALRLLVAHASDDALQAHVERHGGELSRIVPDLARRVPDAGEPQSADTETERRLLLEAVVDALATVSREAPVMLVIDDAHWADSGSISMLRHVVAHVDPAAPLLLAVTYRDTDVDRGHALRGALADLHRAARSERLNLRGLDEGGTRQLLEGAGGHKLERDEELRFVRRLVEDTEGNPFFISELLRHMVETGLLVQEDGRWVGTISPEEGGLPEGVRDVVGQRLSRLAPEANELLRTAAVIGREFDIDLLAEVAELPEGDIVDMLDDAVAARLLNEVADEFGRYSFEHALVRQTLLEELSTNKRVRLHRAIAETLDARGDTPIDVLAHHYCEAALAGVAERAVETGIEAATVAINAVAFDDAIRLLERAREAYDAFSEPEPGTECDLLTELARAEHARGNADVARDYALEAVAIARRIEDPVRLGEAGQAYQGELGMWARPRDEVAVGLLREAIEQLPSEELGARARVSAALAHALILSPGRTGLDAADEAVEAAEQAGDDIALRRALLVRAWCVRGTLPVAQRLEAAQRAVSIAREHKSRYDEYGALYQLGTAVLSTGDLEGAEAVFASQADFAGALQGWALADMTTARAYAEGRYDEGDRLCAHAHELGESLGDTNEGVRAVQMFVSQIERGNVDEAATWLARLLETAVGLGTPASAQFALARGDVDVARSELDRWMSELYPFVPDLLRLTAMSRIASMVFALGGHVGTEGVADYSGRFAGELIASDVWLGGAADWYRGLFAAVEGRLDDAVTLVRGGHEMHVRLGLTARVAQTGLDLGRLLLQRGAPGDESEATALLAGSAELAEQLGMLPTLAAARAALA